MSRSITYVVIVTSIMSLFATATPIQARPRIPFAAAAILGAMGGVIVRRSVVKHHSARSPNTDTAKSDSKDPFAGGAGDPEQPKDPFAGGAAPADYEKPASNK